MADGAPASARSAPADPEILAREHGRPMDGAGSGLVPPRGVYGLGSRRLGRLPGLAGFLPEATGFRPFPMALRGLAAVAGWGLKRHGQRARVWARAIGSPYLALEDGFLRSVGLGVTGARPLSLVIDDLGMYYDATGPSRLEVLIEAGAAETGPVRQRAARCLAQLNAAPLSKYNTGSPPSAELARRLGEDFVLVADQTRGDASVALGLAGEESFATMVQAARDAHPGRVIAVKLHPDVLAGRKRGFLEAVSGDRIVRIEEPLDPAWAIASCRAVFSVTSGLGFEALLQGKRVHTFGLPFYAGWGLTEDTLRSHRRTRRASLEGLFGAAFLLYARYLDPYRSAPASLEETLERIRFLRQRALETSRRTVAVGFTRWKQDAVRPFLAWGGGELQFAETSDQALAEAERTSPPARIVAWASRCPAVLTARARSAGIEIETMEDGFLRSVGLGARLVPPLSLALDPGGVYYDPESGSRLEALLQEGGFDQAVLERARLLVTSITQARLSKYNVGAPLGLRFSADRPNILVPGQVEDDASIRRGTRRVGTNLGLLEAVRAARPEAFLVWKPHPDVTAGFRAGTVPAEAVARLADATASDVSMPDLLDAVEEVHTMTSLTGFEALLRGLRVTCWGQPFYAGWGLTEDRDPIRHRTRPATLDELVAAALILHPRYVDPVTGLPCGPEVAVLRLAEPALWRPGLGLRLRQELARWNKRLRPPR